MLLATIVLLSALPQHGSLASSISKAPAAVSEAAETATTNLPSMPTPKVALDSADPASTSATESSSSTDSRKLNVSSAVEPPASPMPIRPMKPAYTTPRETRGQRIAWYSLAAASHGAAAFDAYSTRLAISRGYGSEGNPFLRPFSHSGALYAATQVSPLVMDYIGKRMMTSQSRWARKLWWLPQTIGGGISVGAGVHNLNLVQ